MGHYHLDGGEDHHYNGEEDSHLEGSERERLFTVSGNDEVEGKDTPHDGCKAQSDGEVEDSVREVLVEQ